MAITRRQLLRGAAGGVGAGMIGGFPASAAERRSRPARRPNLLFVFSDQQSFDMLGCYGNEQILTPNTDRLASEGVRFKHCVSSYPVCTPYRGMLLSGMHPLRNGAMINDLQLLPSAAATEGRGKYFAEVLRDAGYHTGYVGKWHLHGGDRMRPIPPGPCRYGFDETFLSNNCHVDFRAGKCFYWDERGERVFFDEWEPWGQTRQALQFLDQAPEDRPFALFVSWHPPHDMAHDAKTGEWMYPAPDELMERYDPAKIRTRPGTELTDMRRRMYRGHMAMCTGVDMAFGRLMEKLREMGLDRDTIVVFTSDHGDMLGSHDAPGPKPYPEDYATRVPLVVRWPGRLPTGKSSDLLVGTLDLMPTLLGLAGLPVPRTCEGKDLSRAVIKGDSGAVDSVPLFVLRGYHGVYTHEHTYTYSNINRPWAQAHWSRLYDRKRDGHQLRNLYGAEEHRGLQERLHRLSREWMERFGDRDWSWESDIWPVCIGGPYRDVLCRKGDTGILRGRPIDLLKAAGR